MPLLKQQKPSDVFAWHTLSSVASDWRNRSFAYCGVALFLLRRQIVLPFAVIPIFLWVLGFLCKAAKPIFLCFNSFNEALGSSLLSNVSRISSIRPSPHQGGLGPVWGWSQSKARPFLLLNGFILKFISQGKYAYS